MKIFLALIITSIFLNATTLNIAVAANVSYAIKELQVAFEKEYPDIKCHIILGSSGKLTAQIEHGAPFHIFMSANMRYPERLYKNTNAITPPKVYAKGKIALLFLKEQKSLSLTALQNATIKRVAIANPKTAPYGVAAKEALTNAKLYKKLKPKFIYGESIAQTLSYTISAADAGIIAASALYSPKMSRFKEGKEWINIDTQYYEPIEQGIVILKSGAKMPAAQQFYDFILSKKAASIFLAYGYLPSE